MADSLASKHSMRGYKRGPPRGYTSTINHYHYQIPHVPGSSFGLALPAGMHLDSSGDDPENHITKRGSAFVFFPSVLFVAKGQLVDSKLCLFRSESLVKDLPHKHVGRGRRGPFSSTATLALLESLVTMSVSFSPDSSLAVLECMLGDEKREADSDISRNTEHDRRLSSRDNTEEAGEVKADVPGENKLE
ncbi:hypothetical protein AGABI1DRAFT_91245 [Agaricus bisporus var. burnettii JB137-S8]|uniref:Uncharacterized protein n=1 Tax=Agaricus bisporus var. burnettii (strain JB137-S8 / ATCC MYA-4627 / FGSC 10392) TaxID=597362 RepID=K5XX90_AGABU|nr:uncharacterized protein AGABI1DRAFT_91245 [Agaricus bisporus var. burnettii JB137-S8]EKM79905.1 hypothetical protein AGABI1DRAFT_91245 [Agaricus bisporus var. burnettii JB137-S8]